MHSGSESDAEAEARGELLWRLLSSEELGEEAGAHGGSALGKRRSRLRDAQGGHLRIMRDYFMPRRLARPDGGCGPIFTEGEFERRFRMPRRAWNKLREAALSRNEHFKQKSDAAGLPGSSGLQKMVSAIRQLACGAPADATAERCRISETVANRSMKELCGSIAHCLKDERLRAPTEEGIARIEEKRRLKGFPGAIGCLGCAGWEWKNCPAAWQGARKGKGKTPTARMEAISDEDLRIWRLFFGQPGSRSDLSILEISPMLQAIRAGKLPPTKPSTQAGDLGLKWRCFLTDGICPKRRIFAHSCAGAVTEMEKHFAKAQEGARKSVERVLGALFQRLNILHMPSRLWHKDDMTVVVTACVIIHSMVVEERKAGRAPSSLQGGLSPEDAPTALHRIESGASRRDQVSRWRELESLEDSAERCRLKKALAEKMWRSKGCQLDD